MVDRGALSIKILSSYHDSAIGVRPFYPFIYSFIFPNISARHSLQYPWNNPFIMITPSNNYKQINPKNINYNSYIIIEILLLMIKSSEPISLGKDFSECICPKHEQVSIAFLFENNSLGAQTIMDKTRWDTPLPFSMLATWFSVDGIHSLLLRNIGKGSGV